MGRDTKPSELEKAVPQSTSRGSSIVIVEEKYKSSLPYNGRKGEFKYDEAN